MLALLAAMLLALLPTLGRLAQASTAPQPTSITQQALTALCTMEGMKQVALPVLAVASTHAHLQHEPRAPGEEQVLLAEREGEAREQARRGRGNGPPGGRAGGRGK